MTSKSTKIYVGNIPDNCSVDQLSALFAKFGRIQECDIVKNYAFIHMSTHDECKSAVEELNGNEFMGNKLIVEISHSKVRTKPGMGGRGQCYRCGRSGHWSKECPRNSLERVLSSLRANRFSPYGGYSGYSGVYPAARSRPFDRDRYDHYYKDGYDIPPFERLPLPGPDPYPMRPSPDYFRPLVPDPYDHYFERRVRDSPYITDPTYPE